jgi:hypothetical protein
MDWIGDKVSHLLEEAKRALGREIVVMSDAKEDEVDDGSGAWVEEDEEMPSISASAGPSRSRPGSIKRRHRPRDIALHQSPPMSSHNNQLSPKPIGAAAASVESLSIAPALAPAKEDPSSWESPELRELMERARAKYHSSR